MMNQKKIAVIFILFAITVFTGCEKTDTEVPTSDRDKFLGTWSAQSTGSGGTRNFQLTITASNSAPDQVIMQNFDFAGTNTYIPAVISGNSLTIIRTVVSNETYEGTGNYSSGNLNFNFTVDDGQTVESRTCTAHK